MEAPGDTEGPFTSTPRESPPPPPPPPPEPPQRTESSTSSSSESSGEDWLIKVCCPGARHRYRRYAKYRKPKKTEFLHSLDEEDGETKSIKWRPITSYQMFTGIPKQESSELQWLIRLRCPRAEMEEMIPDAKQSLPEAATSLSRSPSKTRSPHTGGLKISESWLKQKHFSLAQALVNERQNLGSTQSLLEKENCFIRGGAFLESYSPSSYDPFFLKTCTDVWKVSVPLLHDPLLKDIRRRYLEAGIIQQCDTGRIFSPKEMNELHKVELPLLPLSRQLMSPVDWQKVPPGYMESEVRVRSRRKMLPTRNESTMDFRSWDDTSCSSANKRHTSARKPDAAPASSSLTKQMIPSIWKSIKSAS